MCFLDLLGVAGGVDMHPDFEASRLMLIVVPLLLLTTIGRSLIVIVKCSLESAIMRWVRWDDGFKQRGERLLQPRSGKIALRRVGT